MDDVARVAGVSRGTVSRLLNGGHNVSPPAAEAVRKAIRKTGYVINQHARSLVTQRSESVAFILSGEMAVAYWMFHAPQSTFPSVNQGEAAILFCFIFLLIAAAGPGPWSLDASRGKKLVQTEDAGEPVP